MKTKLLIGWLKDLNALNPDEEKWIDEIIQRLREYDELVTICKEFYDGKGIKEVAEFLAK